MKKSLIALAVAAGTIAAAQADTTTLYGSLGFSSVISQTRFDSNDKLSSKLNDTLKGFEDNHWDIATTTAKFGVKGTEDLGNGTQVFYKFEFGGNVGSDTVTQPVIDENGQIKTERGKPVFKKTKVNGGLSKVNYAYIGFKGDFGTVTIGKQKSLLKAITDTNLFQEVGVGYNFAGTYPGTVSKAVSYVTPISAGVQFGASVVADNDNFDSLGADAWEIAAMYNVDGWNAGLVYTHVTKGTPYNDGKKIKVRSDGTEEFIGLNVGYGTDQYNVVGRVVHQASTGTEYGLEGEYIDGANTFRAGVGAYDAKASGVNNVYNVALGYQYNFSQRTYTWVEGQYTDYNQDGVSNGFKALVGVRHDF